MSTNYYLRATPVEPCPTCGHDRTPHTLMVGHSGGGWLFLWKGYHEGDERTGGRAITTPSEWHAYLAERITDGAVLEDEYGSVHSLDWFLAFVASKRDPFNGRCPSRHSDLGYPSGAQYIEGDEINFGEFS